MSFIEVTLTLKNPLPLLPALLHTRKLQNMPTTVKILKTVKITVIFFLEDIEVYFLLLDCQPLFSILFALIFAFHKFCCGYFLLHMCKLFILLITNKT